ncbi:MAG: cysteine--tRNA ligase [bacterium]|nr:cysteine--tRNA ligase [bacterium]
MAIDYKLKLFNTLSKKKEDFVPIQTGKASMYLCGPTVYDRATIGNFRTYIFGDILNRVLKYNDYDVKYVQNITDVGHLTDDADQGEDKMEKGSRKAGKSAREVAEEFTQLYFEDSAKLNIERPTVSCKATEHIKEQIEMIEELEKKGFTYKTSDGIYFDTSKQPDYGALAHLDKAGLQEGARVGVNTEKRNITDFALWKFSPKDEQRHMEWESPWGMGFPGWHIECSAMSIKYLGQPFDLHAGGMDLLPVHHTNEVAQNEAIYGHKTVNYWLHGGFILVDGKKMGKSLGNAYTLDDIAKEEFNNLVFRYLTFTAHYRQELNFTWESLSQAGSALSKLYKIVGSFLNNKPDNTISDEWSSRFLEAVNDDLNIPKAIAVVWEMIRDKNTPETLKLSTLYKFDEILGLDIEKNAKNYAQLIAKIPESIKQIKEDRDIARQNKDWKKSDELRDELESKGYEVEDAQDGTKVLPKINL